MLKRRREKKKEKDTAPAELMWQLWEGFSRLQFWIQEVKAETKWVVGEATGSLYTQFLVLHAL